MIAAICTLMIWSLSMFSNPWCGVHGPWSAHIGNSSHITSHALCPTPHSPLTIRHRPQTISRFAVIIAGVGGESVYTDRFARWTEAMVNLLRHDLHFTDDHIFYLTASPPRVERHHATKATADEVKKTFGQLKVMAGPDSLIFVFLVGHGSFSDGRAKFNLAGPDLTAGEFDHLLDALPTPNIIVVNAASASAPFIQVLSQPGRIIITATRSGHERNATRFAEFFLQAFEQNRADGDKNGRVSMLEAFSFTSKLTNQWYDQHGRLATEHAQLDDNGDKVGHPGPIDGDGALARTVYLDPGPLALAGGDPELYALLARKEELARSVEALKARKTAMPPAAYEAELERLLIQLAEVSQHIKKRRK